MASKKAAQAEARKLRKLFPNATVNVKEITKGNWGCRFSSKGKRDILSYKNLDYRNSTQYQIDIGGRGENGN